MLGGPTAVTREPQAGLCELAGSRPRNGWKAAGDEQMRLAVVLGDVADHTAVGAGAERELGQGQARVPVAKARPCPRWQRGAGAGPPASGEALDKLD